MFSRNVYDNGDPVSNFYFAVFTLNIWTDGLDQTL